jgi:predicted phage terminase large subunit-like protein
LPDLDKLRELRKRARTDLFWLATQILGYDLQEDVHRPICEFFVKKDPSQPFADQDVVKNRLLLDPRGHFKTTIDIADAVQWILGFPNIRILFMSGKQDLAERMLFECQQHFQVNEKMRALFPEFCVPEGKKMPGTEFTSPARSIIKREPTLSISTIESARASLHFDLGKFDDCVNEINSSTQEQNEKVKEGINYTAPLIDPGGYRDFIGTRYDYSDYYGYVLENHVWRPADHGSMISDDGTWKYHARKAWNKQPQHSSDPEVKLLFPQRRLKSGKLIGLTIAELMEKQKDDPYIFSCQYLNDPTQGDSKTFNEEILLRHTLPHLHVPRMGRNFIAWDLGYSQKEFADFSVGAVGRYDEQGRLWILDLAVGRYSAWEIVQQFFRLLTKWRPTRVGIEEASGSPLLAPALYQYSRDHQIYMPLDWLKLKKTKGAKEQRIAGLLALMEEDRLYFSASCPNRDEMFKQFIRFPRYKHNDIPDAISMLLEYRNTVDINWPDDRIEMVSAPIFGDGELGAGIVG